MSVLCIYMSVLFSKTAILWQFSVKLPYYGSFTEQDTNHRSLSFRNECIVMSILGIHTHNYILGSGNPDTLA